MSGGDIVVTCAGKILRVAQIFAGFRSSTAVPHAPARRAPQPSRE